MAEILTFVLVAPLGAMGGVAVGENRTGCDRPGRSVVLGLVAGCLGLTRSEEAAQTELAEGLGLGLRREGVAGPLLTDYHTAQTQASRKGRRFATRRGIAGAQPGDGAVAPRLPQRLRIHWRVVAAARGGAALVAR